MIIDLGKQKYLFRRQVFHTVYRIDSENSNWFKTTCIVAYNFTEAEKFVGTPAHKSNNVKHMYVLGYTIIIQQTN